MDSTLNNDDNNCNEILLSAYLDGEVTAEERHAVEDHIAHCASCAELVARMQHVEDALRMTVLPRILHEQIKKSVTRESSQSSLRRALRWGGVAAALLVSFGLGIWTAGGTHRGAPVRIAKDIDPSTSQAHSQQAPTISLIAKEINQPLSRPKSGAPVLNQPNESMGLSASTVEQEFVPDPSAAQKNVEKSAAIDGVGKVLDTKVQKTSPVPKAEKASSKERGPDVAKSKDPETETHSEPTKPIPAVSPKEDVAVLPRLFRDGPKLPLEFELPEPYFGGTPLSYFNENLEEKSFKPREPFLAPRGTKVISRGKPVSSSDLDPTFGKLSMITDGEKGYQQEYLVELGTGPQWAQIDLDESYAIYAILIWHFHAADRVYFDVVVQTGLDPDMEQSNICFNNDYDNSLGLGIGRDKEYIESNEGKLVNCRGKIARHVRFYSNGNTTDQTSHYVEVEVWGIPVDSKQ